MPPALLVVSYYPISLNINTLRNLGIVRVFLVGTSYIKARLFPIREEKSLEDFVVNRFGRHLYETFFRDYTQKVWGVPCNQIKPEWGAQRIKGLSISKALWHAFRSIWTSSTGIAQKGVETSLIGQFFYPKFGPGQMWEEVTRLIRQKGGEVRMHQKVVSISYKNNQVHSVTYKNVSTGKEEILEADYIFSSMPVKELIQSMGESVPKNVQEVSQGLQYRDFITVGLLCDKLLVSNKTKYKSVNNIVPDNWIYIQERDVKVGRLQIFNNWSPYMVVDTSKVWIGLEYFCNEGDALWNKKDKDLIKFGIKELEKIGMVKNQDVFDGVVIRQKKAYPAYFGTYDRFSEIREFTDKIENLFLIGRNGMHKYNNQDHSMLSAMTAVDNVVNKQIDKSNIWEVNTETVYHEKK